MDHVISIYVEIKHNTYLVAKISTCNFLSIPIIIFVNILVVGPSISFSFYKNLKGPFKLAGNMTY